MSPRNPAFMDNVLNIVFVNLVVCLFVLSLSKNEKKSGKYLMEFLLLSNHNAGLAAMT